MQITENVVQEVAVLEVSGRVDSSTSGVFEERLCARVQASSAVVVDFSEARYISSAGLRALLKAAKLARSCGHSLALCGLSIFVHEVFDVSGFSSLFNIYGDRGQALAALG